MSTITPFPRPSRSKHTSQEDFEREVAAHFGRLPNFFSIYAGRPFGYSRIVAVREVGLSGQPHPDAVQGTALCLSLPLLRSSLLHHATLRLPMGLGQSGGDPDAPVMTIAQVVRLLQRPIPSDEQVGQALARLQAVAVPIDWPSPETSYDEDLLTSATMLFLQPARAERAKRALRTALGGEKFELLVGFLTFIRSAHYWTLMHPELALEDDIKELLREHEQLAQLLLEDPEAGRCEMGARLFDELVVVGKISLKLGNRLSVYSSRSLVWPSPS